MVSLFNSSMSFVCCHRRRIQRSAPRSQSRCENNQLDRPVFSVKGLPEPEVTYEDGLQRCSILFRLPPEIRKMIYDYYFQFDSRPLHLFQSRPNHLYSVRCIKPCGFPDQCWRKRDAQKPLGNTLGLSLSCKQMYRDVTSPFALACAC